MEKLKDLTAKEFVDRYNPARTKDGFATKAEWRAIRPFVEEAMTPVMHLKATGLRPFLIALTRIGVFAHKNGQPLEVSRVLAPAMINAFLAQLKKGERDVAPRLWRLSKAWGLVPSTTVAPSGIPRPDYLTPYTDDEIETLLDVSEHQPTQHRRATLLAIIFLGAGAGVVRTDAREVTVSDIHHHASGDLFVFANDHCAKVRPEFVELAAKLKELRPKGRLRGNRKPGDVTTNAAVWIANRYGVPALSANRLRATYISALINQGVSLFDLITWTGLQSAEALDGYLDQLKDQAPTCSHRSKESK